MRNYMRSIDDARERLVSYFYLHDCGDAEIRMQMGISREKLDGIKASIRRHLIAAGIRPTGA